MEIKKKVLLFIIILISIKVVAAEGEADITFIPPTPDNNTLWNQTTATINISVVDINDTIQWIDWNYSLVGYWNFDYPLTANKIADNSTYDNDGAGQGGWTVANGVRQDVYGQAGVFNGSSDVYYLIEVGSPPEFQMNNESFTAVAWAKWNGSTTGGLNRNTVIGHRTNPPDLSKWGIVVRDSTGECGYEVRDKSGIQ
ncbi:unnamed protein product, partial [marine sediment metagenome]